MTKTLTRYLVGRGRHKRPYWRSKRRPVPPRSYTLCAAAVAAISVGAGILSLPISAQAARPARPAVLRPTRMILAFTPNSVQVNSGDTLSSISKRVYGSKRQWPALWYANKDRVPNPNWLRTGQWLRISTWHPHRQWLTDAAYDAIPAPAPPVAVSPLIAPLPAPVGSQPSYSYTGGSSFQQCVISRESGGNPSAVNPSSGAGGLYQFLPSTWAALGHSGLPENASVAEQNQAFQQAMSQPGGASNWAPYDGC